jgi:hypothetical protein
MSGSRRQGDLQASGMDGERALIFRRLFRSSFLAAAGSSRRLSGCLLVWREQTRYIPIWFITCLFCFVSAASTGQTWHDMSSGQVVFGQVEEFSGPATHVSNHQSCQKSASGTDPSQSGSVAAIRTCRDRVRLRVCRRRPHSPHLPQPHTRHRLNRQL